MATAPITAFAFGMVAPVGVVANLLAIPLAGLAVPAVFASIVAGGLAAAGAGLALAATERAASLAATVPGGHLAGEPGFAFALPWAALLAVLVWVGHRRPAWVVARRRLLFGAAGASWILAALPLVPLSRHAAVEI